MKKTIKMTEGQLTSLIKKVIKEHKFDRHSDLAELVSRVESELNIDHGSHEMTGDVKSQAKNLLHELSRKSHELKKLEIELKSALMGMNLSTKDFKGRGDDTMEF